MKLLIDQNLSFTLILYLGNTTTVAVERLIRSHAAEITAFETDGEPILRVR